MADKFTQSGWTFPVDHPRRPASRRQVCGYFHHIPDADADVLYIFATTTENIIDLVGIHVVTHTYNRDDVVRQILKVESQLPPRATGFRTTDIRTSVGGPVLREALAQLRNRDDERWPWFHPTQLMDADGVAGDPADVNANALTHARLAVRYADMIASGVAAPRRELAKELSISEDGLKSRLKKATAAGMWIPSRGRRFGSASELAYRTVDQAEKGLS